MGFFHKIFHMEDDFVNFLIRAEDVISFVKKHTSYCGIKNNLLRRERKWRRFSPDFIIKAKHGYYLVKTKGREEIQVPDKNIATQKWYEAVSKGISKRWVYLYLREGEWSGKITLKDCEEDGWYR